MSFIANLGNILKKLELAALAVFAIGCVLKVLQLPGTNEALLVGLMSLAMIYFLSGFVPLKIAQGNQPHGFTTVLVPILIKVLYIGLAVFCVALLFTFLQYPGANEQMMIGLSSLVVGSAMGMALVLSNRKHMELLKGALIRSIVAILFYLILGLL